MQATHAHEHHDHDHHHTREFDTQGWLRVAVLFGLGVYFSYNILTGNLTNYINVRFSWLSYLAAGLFLLLALGGAWDLLRDLRHPHDEEDDHDHAHHHDDSHPRVSLPALLVVAIPLVLGTLVPSRPLGAEAVDGNLSLNAASATTGSTTFTVNPLDRNVLDWLRVFNSVSDYSEINGEPADVIGFVYREPTFGDNQFMVARFTISCCVADASAIGLPVAWGGAGELPADTWVRVQGTMQAGEFRGESAPILQASSVEQVEQPKHPYLYP